MPELDRLIPEADTDQEVVAPEAEPGDDSASARTEDELAGPDRSGERIAIYSIIFVVLITGSFVLRSDSIGQSAALVWESSAAFHTVMEAVATV